MFGNGGALSTTINSNGSLNVGDLAKKAGSLSITGGYTQAAGGVLNIDIGGAISGTEFDVLNISGAANLNGTLNISLIGGFVPAIGSTFKILNCASRTGTFSVINGIKIDSSEHFEVVYNSADVTLHVVSGP